MIVVDLPKRILLRASKIGYSIERLLSDLIDIGSSREETLKHLATQSFQAILLTVSITA